MPRLDRNSDNDDGPGLTTSLADLEAEMGDRIARGEALLTRPPVTQDDQLTQLRNDFETWDEFNVRLLRRRFTTGQVSEEYQMQIYLSGGRSVSEKAALVRRDIASQLRKLQSIRGQLPLFPVATTAADFSASNSPALGLDTLARPATPRVFIGHGRSASWRELKDFLTDRLNLNYDEFNRVSAAGLATTQRLWEMLEHSSLAFLICTAEDEHVDGSQHARENVVHEAGLFQGRLGFQRAIVLLEEGCAEFSNIHGLGQIRFPRGRISAVFEEVRKVLERERLIEPQGKQ